MPDTITGGRTTTNILSDKLAIDISDRIHELEPNVDPLREFSRRAAKRRTVATKFNWIEDEGEARFDAVNNIAGYASGATSIVVDNGSYFAQHDQVLITRTGEMIRVDGVASNTLTVTRGVGSTAAAINDNDELLILSSAQPENDTSKPARSGNESKLTNYTQIFRDPVEASDSLRASSFQVSPADWPHQIRKKGRKHLKDIEYAFLFGRKSLDTSGATERRTTGGALANITTNATDAGGDLSETEFNAAMLQAFRYGSQTKLAFASGVAVSALNKFPASKQQTRNNEKTYGMNVTRFESPFGAIELVYHRLLEGTKYGGYIVIVDMDHVAYRYLASDELNRDTKWYQNIQPNDQDGRKDEIKSEVGLEFGTQRAHAVITGITS